MGIFSPPPGVDDLLPEAITAWQFIEKTAAAFFPLYGFGEIRTPIFEYTEVFSKGIGEQTEVVQKEMYTFEDRGGRSLTLRPEGTAGIIRALGSIEQGSARRVYYIGPMFRGERPAAGRKRQFHQVGVENIGSVSPELDAECIVMLTRFLEKIGIRKYSLKINTRGDAADRAATDATLRNLFSKKKDTLCEDCKKRFDRNVWRILDCKNPGCAEISASLELEDIGRLFSRESKTYLDSVTNILAHEKIPFVLDPRLVRGLDYYAHTVFEVSHDGLGAQNAVAGGGRYEITPPGSKNPVRGVGFACGIERLIIAASSENHNPAPEKKPFVFIVSIGKNAKLPNFSLAEELRAKGISAIADFEERSIKSAMRSANKSGAAFTIIRGDNELSQKTTVIKNMSDGAQAEIPESKTIEYLSKYSPNGLSARLPEQERSQSGNAQAE
jgi:histidyl-tRNA synthetase